MGSSSSIDIDLLLSPVSEANAVGDNLREDISPSSPYYLLKDVRKAARAKERGGAFLEGEVPDLRADWQPVLEQSRLLLTRSKDLEIVAWLIEALVRLHGFAGLRDGFQLTRGVIDRYWDSCYPPLDDIEERTAPLSGLNGQDAEGTLIVPIRNVAITQGQSAGPFASWQLQQAVALQQISDPAVRENRIKSGAVTMEAIDKAAMETEASFFRTQLDDLQACRQVFAELGERLDDLCGLDNAPPSSNIRNELDACLEALKYVGRRALESPEEAQSIDGDSTSEDGVDSQPAVANMPAGHPKNREQAFQTLLQLADFFRRTEPHSPLSYTIEQVVRWGRMPLPDLLEEIIAEDNARENLFRLAGIKRPDQES